MFVSSKICLFTFHRLVHATAFLQRTIFLSLSVRMFEKKKCLPIHFGNLLKIAKIRCDKVSACFFFSYALSLSRNEFDTYICVQWNPCAAFFVHVVFNALARTVYVLLVLFSLFLLLSPMDAHVAFFDDTVPRVHFNDSASEVILC